MRKTTQRRGNYGPGGTGPAVETPERLPGGEPKLCKRATCKIPGRYHYHPDEDAPTSPAARVVDTNTFPGALAGIIGTTPERERQLREFNHLEDSMATIMRVLWSRIQEGHFKDQDQAEGLVDARQHVAKARDLARKHMAQLRLPETSTEEEKVGPTGFTLDGKPFIPRSTKEAAVRAEHPERSCRVCGCTEDTACRTKAGLPCSWVEPNLCSACAEKGKADPFDALGTGRGS